MTAEPLSLALEQAIRRDGLVLIGPGIADPLPPGVPRHHVPAGTLISLAEGARLADPSRPVVALGTEADLCGAGLGPLLHAARRNTGITCIVMAGEPGAPGCQPRPVELARAAGGSYLAEVGLDAGLTAQLDAAMAHRGFSLLHVTSSPVGLYFETDELDAFESVLWNQAPIVTAVWTAAPEVWDVLLWGPDDEEEEESDWA